MLVYTFSENPAWRIIIYINNGIGCTFIELAPEINNVIEFDIVGITTTIDIFSTVVKAVHK